MGFWEALVTLVKHVPNRLQGIKKSWSGIWQAYCPNFCPRSSKSSPEMLLAPSKDSLLTSVLKYRHDFHYQSFPKGWPSSGDPGRLGWHGHLGRCPPPSPPFRGRRLPFAWQKLLGGGWRFCRGAVWHVPKKCEIFQDPKIDTIEILLTSTILAKTSSETTGRGSAISLSFWPVILLFGEKEARSKQRLTSFNPVHLNQMARNLSYHWFERKIFDHCLVSQRPQRLF